MSRVMIVCPVTELSVPTKFEVDPSRAFRRELPESGVLVCEACGRRHSWHRTEALLEGQPAPSSRRHLGDPNAARRSGWVLRHVEIGPR